VLVVGSIVFNRWRARRKAKQAEEALGNQLVTQALEPVPQRVEPPSQRQP
jgi:hypothetical protein